MLARAARFCPALWYGGLLLIIFLLGLFPMESGDIWWHLRTGEVIWQTRTVPQTDWFTYTNGDAAWIDLHWGFQLLVAGLWHLGGDVWLIVFKALTGVAAFGLCLSVVRPTWHSVLCWSAPIILFAHRYNVRPEMLSFVFLAATLAVLQLASRRPKLIWVLPAIQLAWVNTHSLFCLQYVVLALFLIERGWHSLASRKIDWDDKPGLWRWIISLALMPPATLLNPYGYHGLVFPLELLKKFRGEDRAFFQLFSSELFGFRDIWSRPHGWVMLLDDWRFWVVVGLLSAGLTTCFLLYRQGQLVSYRVLLLCAFAYLTWSMQRNLPLFVLVAGFVLHVNVSELSADSGHAKKGFLHALPLCAAACCLCGFLWSIFSGHYYMWVPHEPPRTLGATAEDWIGMPAIEFLNQPGMPDRIYAVDEKLAARCIYWLGPEKQVFADARLELNTMQTLQQYWDLQFLLPAHNPLAERYLAGPDGGPLPAVMFDNSVLLSFSVQEPRLLPGLLTNERWRCVFSTAADGQISQDRRELQFGVTIFLPVDIADQLELPEAKVSQLLRYTELYAEMQSQQF